MGLSGLMCHVYQTYPSVEISTQRIGENAEECVQLFGYNNITRPLSCFSLETQNALRNQSARKTHTSESKSGESDDPNGFMGDKGIATLGLGLEKQFVNFSNYYAQKNCSQLLLFLRTLCNSRRSNSNSYSNSTLKKKYPKQVTPRWKFSEDRFPSRRPRPRGGCQLAYQDDQSWLTRNKKNAQKSIEKKGYEKSR